MPDEEVGTRKSAAKKAPGRLPKLPAAVFHHKGNDPEDRRPSVQDIVWRHEQANPNVVKAEIHEIDEGKCAKKIKGHCKGLWVMQIFGGVIALFTSILAEYRYGSSAWYNSASAGGKLADMQFAWAIITFICGCIGIWVYLCWKEDINLSRGRLIFRQKVFYYFSFFAWAFGVWTTAVLFASFKNYSLRPGIYPGDLTGCFLVMACTLLFQDLWALSKLCSLGTYTAKLAEEWRYQAFVDKEDAKEERAEEAAKEQRRASQEERRSQRRASRVEEGRGGGEGGGKEGRRSSQERRKSSIRIEVPPSPSQAGTAPPSTQGGLTPSAPLLSPHELVNVALHQQEGEEEDVLMPHAFERLWNGLERVGGFSARIAAPVHQDDIVAHLTERGFQVVAAGRQHHDVLRLLFCRREAAEDGLGEWFLAELEVNEQRLVLEAEFKSKRPQMVPDFVKQFRLHNVFNIVD